MEYIIRTSHHNRGYQVGYYTSDNEFISCFYFTSYEEALEKCAKLNSISQLPLRDYIACKAMQSLITLYDNPTEDNIEKIASKAYQYADAMMVERNKK